MVLQSEQVPVPQPEVDQTLPAQSPLKKDKYISANWREPEDETGQLTQKVRSNTIMCALKCWS